LRQHARDDVGRSAGAVGYDDAYRFCRIGLRKRHVRDGQADDCGNNSRDTAHDFSLETRFQSRLWLHRRPWRFYEKAFCPKFVARARFCAVLRSFEQALLSTEKSASPERCGIYPGPANK